MGYMRTKNGRRLDEFEAADILATGRARRVIALRSNHYGASTYLSASGQTASTYRAQHILVPNITCTGIQLLYGNFALNPGPSTLTIRASIHWNGKSYQVTWGGNATVTIPSGAYAPLSDPLPLLVDAALASAFVFYSETFVSVPTSGQWPVGLGANPINGEGSNIGNPGADLTVDGQYKALGTLPSSGQNAGMYTPLAVIGIPSENICTFGLVTDSIGIGTGDTPSTYGSGDVALDFGFLMRALNRQYGYVWHAKYNDTAFNMLDTIGYRARQLEFATHTICTLGVNDLQASRTIAQVANAVIGHARHAATRKNPFFVTTIAPRVTSTDLYATVSGQTSDASDSVRVAYNTWLRAGAPVDPTTRAYVAVGTSGALLIGDIGHPFTGYREVADALESARNSGKFKAAERTVTDAVVNATTTVTSATAAFTSADVGKVVIIEGAGSGASTLIGRIAAVVNATTITLASTAGASGTGKRIVIAPYVIDGVHWGAAGHAAAAAVMDIPGIIAATRPAFG